jgi:hypothetical protein
MEVIPYFLASQQLVEVKAEGKAEPMLQVQMVAVAAAVVLEVYIQDQLLEVLEAKVTTVAVVIIILALQVVAEVQALREQERPAVLLLETVALAPLHQYQAHQLLMLVAVEVV